MVLVNVKNVKGYITEFEIKGHAGYAKSGQDIICAAASAISYTALGYFENKYNPKNDKNKVLFIEKNGYIIWRRPEPLDEKSLIEDNAVLNAMILGFKQVEYTYGKKYLTVKEEEV